MKRATLIPILEPVVSRNRCSLSSLFVSEENEEQNSFQSEGEKKQGCGSSELELDVKELKDQAKFLKSCGTLPETPLEIRKLSKKCSDLSTQRGEDKPLKFHSWLSDSPIEKQKLLLEADQSPPPTKDVRELAKGADSSVHTPSRQMNPVSSATLEVKSVHQFDWIARENVPVIEAVKARNVIRNYYHRNHVAEDNLTDTTPHSFASKLQARSPKHISLLNHLRTYPPELFPNLDKVVFLDNDDIVIQRDLSLLFETMMIL